MPLSTELLDAMRATLAMMPQQFDTHAFILRLAGDHQRVYIESLDATPSTRPFQQLHAEIGRAIKSQFGDAIEQIAAEHISNDIFGNSASCSMWQQT